MTLNNELKHLKELLVDEEWLCKFCTYKQLRSILHRMEKHPQLMPDKLTIETDTEQNFGSIQYTTGEKITF